MSTRKQIAENQKILYDDAVANNMFQAAVPSFEEFQKRLERSDYQKIVYDNYRKHDVKGTGFNSLEEFRGKFGGSFYSDEAKREFNNNAQYISDAAKQSVNNFGKYNKLKQHKQKQKNDFGRVTIGSNKTPFGGNADDVVKDDFAIDPATGKTGAYITSDNDETSNLAEAQQKQAALDSYNETYQKAVDTGEIPSVFDVRDKDGNYDLQENIGKDGTYLTEEGAQAQLDKKLAEAYARKEELENAIAEDDKKNGNPLLSYSVSMGGSNGRDAKSSDYRNQLAISLSLVKQQIGSLEAVKQYPTSSMASDAWKALDNTAFTAKTWDFGITDFATMGQMERIKSKMDNKIPLTTSEQTLLKSKLGADAAEALENEKMGNVYRWTKIAGQSLPFMLDFFLTGGYGGITDALTKSALKFAAKKGMGKISAAVLKNTGVVLGDIAGSYAMAGTTQAAKTGADIMQRHMGNLYQDENGNYAFGTFDENGNLVHEGGESFGTALYKGLTSAMVENYTEKLFGHSYGVKKGALAFMEKHGMAKSAEFFKNIGKKEWYAGAKKWMGKFGINGFGEEVMEEEIGIPLHALLDGDNKFSDLWDAKQQLDIIGGMAISVGSMYAMGAGTRPLKGVYNRSQYYRFKHKVTAADNEAFQLLGADYWPELRERMDNATNEQMGGVLYSILQGRDTLSKEQIKAAVMYGVNLMKMRGYNLAKTAEMNAREMTGEQESDQDNHDNEIENAYSEGHDAEGESTHAIQLEQNESATRLAGLLGITEEQLHDMSDDELEAKAGENDELDEAIYDYQASTAKYQGVMDNANDKVDMAGREAALMIDQRTDLSRGTVRTASIKATKGAEDYDVFIISGNLTTHDDGTIDISSSDQMILYYDPKTGRKEYADPSRFASIGEEQSAEEAKNQAIMEAKDKVIREQAGIIDGKVEEGSTFVITDADGTEHTYEVLADNGDGTAMITLDGNVEYNPYSLNDLQQLKDAEDQKKLIAARQQRAELESQRQQQKQNEQKQNEENQARISQTISEITDDNGNVVIAAVEGEEDADSFIVGEYNNKKSGKKKYKVVTLNADGTVSSPRLVDTSKVTIMDTMPADEYQQVLNDTQTTVIEDNGGLDNSQEDNLGDELPPVPDNVTINGDGTYAVDGEKQVKQESQNEENTPAVPSFTLSDGTEVPMREDGNPDTTQMTAAQTAEFYDTQFGEDAEGLINGWVSDAKKALDTANKMTVKGKDFVEQKASKDAKTKTIADAQAKYDSAQAIADAYKERMLAKQESTAEGRRSILDKAKAKYNRLKGKAEQVQALWNETVGTVLHRLYDHTGVDVFDSTPQTIEEYVSSSIAPFSLNYEGNDNSKGVKQETGLERKDFAKSHVLAAEGKGITVDEFVHKLWENRPAQFESATDQDIRNALIELITSDMNAYDMRHVIENNRIAQAEKAIEDEQNAAESAAHEEETRAAAEEETTAETETTETEEGAPAETDDALPFAPSDESDAPFSERDNIIIESQQERSDNVEKNHVDDVEVVDAIVGKKVRKALERIAKMMGAKIQWQYSDRTGNGWYDEATNTIYLTLDSSITEGAQFIFGHEMTHEIKSKNPAAYEELKTLVKDMLGEDTFETMTDVTEQKYRDAGIIYTGGREAYEEEVVADQMGTWLNDANYAHTLALKMSHPLLAAIHDIIVRIKMAFNGTEYTDNAKQILRTIEQAYVVTANREAVNTAIQEGEGSQRMSLRTKPAPKKTQKVYKLMRLGEDGKLYPLFIGSAESVELGKWYDADSPALKDLKSLSSKDYVGKRTVTVDGEDVQEEYNYGSYIVNNETGEAMSLADFKKQHKGDKRFSRIKNNPNVAALNWATDNGYRWIKIEEKKRGQSRYGGENRSYYNYGINGTGAVGIFAMRPGWHAGSLPTMRQIGKGQGKNLRDDTFVWVEGEIPADYDYNEEAQKNADKDIPDHIPTDGFYLKATNANKEASQADKVGWYVAGAFRPNRIMSDKETREVIDQWNKEHPNDEPVEYDWKRESGKDFNAETMSLEDTPKFSLREYRGNGTNLSDTDSLQSEKKDLQNKIKGWLTDENIDWAEGKELKDVIERFGNTPEPIAVMPTIIRENLPSLEGDYLYCGKAYMIDHQANHHPELGIDEYDNIQTILDNYDDIKDLSDGGRFKVAFVKKIDKGYAIVAELSAENDKIVLHKTFFYRGAQGKRIPYKNKPSILEKWSEDGSTSIGPADNQHPADTENISALDSSSAAKIDNSSESSKENGEKFSLKDDKTLVGVHNITEDKLRKALKLGGFANPSVAIIDTDHSAHNSYGEISFIAPSVLVDKKTGGTAGTWTTDAYTQRYPSVERQMSDKGYRKFVDWVDSLDFTDSEKAEIKRQAKDALESNGEPAWELMYLREKGIDIKGYNSKVDYLWQNIIEEHPSAEDILESMKSDPKLNNDVTGLAKSEIISPIWRNISQEVRAQVSEEEGRIVSVISPKVRAKVKEIFERDYAPKLLNKDGSPKKSDVKKVVSQIVQQYEDTKTFSFQKSKVRASSYVHNNGLYTDYLRWQENKLDEYGTKNRLFRGYKNDGTRKYIPETLENVSKAMKTDAEGQTNGSEFTSFGSFIAKVADRVDSTDQMRANKGKLASTEDKQNFYQKWEDVYYELAKFLYNDLSYGEARLHDIVTKKDPKKYAKKEYGITLSADFMKKLDALKKAVRDELKSNYFETKFERPVRLNEFAAAVVPDDLGADVRKGLEESGLPLYDYDANKEGDRQRAFNEAVNSSDGIRFSLTGVRGAANLDKAEEVTTRLDNLNVARQMEEANKSEGWKQANKKAIHIAEAIERDPKFSLKRLDGTLIKAGTYFSGGGLVEEGLKGVIDPVVAVEYDEKISGVYRNNFGKHIVTADVRDVDPKELVKSIDGEVEFFHASPVCKNFSQAKANHEEVELDKETAQSTADFINQIKPAVVTIENVKGYRDSDAMKIITDALDANGYKWDADVYNAADYGGYTSRERLIVRAVKDGNLPPKPEKQPRKSGWYEAVEDIIPTLTEKKNGVAPWMDIRLQADGIDWRNIDKPLYVMGSAYADGKVPHAFADELLPTLRTKSGDVIVMPGGKVYRAMGRVLARVSGMSDDYLLPHSESLAHTIIGNGIPTQLTENVIAPLLMRENPKFSLKKSADNDNGDFSTENNDIRYSLRADRFRHDLNEWKKANNLPKDAQRPSVPVREPNESAADFMNRVKEYRKGMAMWKTAPTYEGHLLTDDTAQGEFNRELQRGAVQARIALQDSMLAIRKAQEAIMKDVGVDRLSMAEDAYTAENRSHGKGKNEFEEYNDEFLQPLRKAYNALMKKLGKSYDNVKVYMIAKHGLERNAHMAFAKALEKDYDKQSDRIDAYNAYKGDVDRLLNDTDYQNGQIDFTTWRQRDNAIRLKYAPSYMDYRYDKMGITQDYSGLSALFDGSDFEEAAADLVKDVETNHPDEAADLWYATNDATKKVLRDSYKAGMMTKDVYEYVRDMYQNYIPLRGWGDTNADQVWNYVGGGKGAFSQTLKEAHGRESLADDPIAYIENMAESGILLNNKNWVKQHLLLLAENHPTSLLNVSKAWYVKTTDAQGNEQWIPASPQITANMTAQQVELALEAFEQKMEQMKQSGDATQKREHLEISYPQTNGEEREHEVRVMRNGEEYVIYINGDPQLAQAMNNTRAQRVREGLQNSISQKVIAWVGRKMAAAYTSLSPLFIPSNYARDLTMTLASSAIREDARYNYLLRKNMLTHWNTLPLVLSYQNGTLREKVRNGSATKTEKMFYDYMMNGGETGFVSSLDVEDLKKKFKNELKDMNRMALNPKKVGHVIMDSIETLNRAIEGSNRFMVYMTSVQYGRSIEEAVNNAKDVTLNFNRKGTGEHGWQTIRNLYLFINPAIQSLQTLGALAKHHPFKLTAVTTAWLASGVLVPIINGLMMSMLGGDDDKDKYWSFTKWDRRNNMIIWVPYTHEFIKIPLAQEFRGFYGVGDMIASKLMGGEKAEQSWDEYAEDFMGQVVDMLPLDPTGYDGNIAVSLMPNPIRPFFELAFNVDFTGKPLFKDSEYNKYDPNFTKAYAGTPDWLVRISKMVNSIGNDYPDVQQNAIDKFGDPRYNLNNPAVVDHILSSYLGGAYTMGSQVLGVATKLLNGDEVKMADVPILSKFVSNPDDRPVSKKQGDEFWATKERHDRAANTLSKLKKKAKVDGDYTTLEMFFSSDEYKQYKEDDKVVKKYEADKKKENAEESGEEYKPHKTTYNDVYKAHATPRDDFEDLKLNQLYQKVKGFSDHWNELLDEGSSLSQGYYEQNADAIQAAEDTKTIIEQMNDIKKGFLNDGKDAYTAEDMKDLRDLRKQALSTLEKAKKGK